MCFCVSQLSTGTNLWCGCPLFKCILERWVYIAVEVMSLYTLSVLQLMNPLLYQMNLTIDSVTWDHFDFPYSIVELVTFRIISILCWESSHLQSQTGCCLLKWKASHFSSECFSNVTPQQTYDISVYCLYCVSALCDKIYFRLDILAGMDKEFEFSFGSAFDRWHYSIKLRCKILSRFSSKFHSTSLLMKFHGRHF